MTAQEAYILAKAYTNKSIEGAGSLKGAACQIKSIETITGGHRITFEWENNYGEVSTDTMDVMDGADGDDGVGISSILYKETDAHGNYIYTVTLTSGSTYDITCPKGAQGETGETGNGIASIEKTGTSGNVDTYTITYTNGQTSTFTVTNGVNPTVDDAMSDSSTNPVQNKVITAALATKQDATDNNLQTTDKTVVGAVNELKSGFTNLDNEVNGDATTYPYADVITIEDAIPSNLVDCNVKIEPVQDLHGYDKPWVGGANTNKYDDSTKVTGKMLNSSGNFTDNDSYDSSDYIDVSNSGGYVSLSWDSQTTYYQCMLCAYDSSKTYISDSYTMNQGYYSTSKFSVPNNAVYVRFSWSVIVSGNPAVRNNIRVNYGETDLGYAPYENICPISGSTETVVSRMGKNFIGILGLWKDDGEFDSTIQGLSTAMIPVVAGQKITCSKTTALTTPSGHTYVRAFDESKKLVNNRTELQRNNVTGSVTYTVPSGVYYVAFTVYMNANDWADKYSFKLQVELGDTATTYEPYAGQTYTIALGDTIYGGTVDFDSGVMTVTHKMVDMGDLSWEYYAVTQGNLFRTYLSDIKQTPASGLASCICSNYSVVLQNHRTNGTISSAIGSNQIDVIDDRYSDATAFKTAMDGVQLVYELATPTTIQLTPQQIQLLKGQNTLTASTGDISVTVNGVSGSIGSVQEQVNATDEALAELAEKLPTAPTTDGAYVLTVTVADGLPTYSWESAT